MWILDVLFLGDIKIITKSSTSKKILDVLFLGDIKIIRSGGNLNPKKVAKRTKISHKKILTNAGLNKGNILRVITGVKSKKRPTTGT
jgi:hypothetical protein